MNPKQGGGSLSNGSYQKTRAERLNLRKVGMTITIDRRKDEEHSRLSEAYLAFLLQADIIALFIAYKH